MNLRDRLQAAINAVSAENGSHTPDYILAEYLIDCLAAFDRAVTARGQWHGRSGSPRQALPPETPP